MAYNKNYLIKESIEAIQKNNLMFIGDLFAFVPFSQATFYNHKLEELEAIKKEFDSNRIKTKHSLKAKWYKSDNPTVQIALYKLIGSEDEVHRLSGTRHEQANTHQFIDGIEIKILDANNDRSKPDNGSD